MGMVFAANPGNKFDAFRAKALAIGAELKAKASASSAAAPSQTSSAAGVKHTIIVGDKNGDTIYTPNQLVSIFVFNACLSAYRIFADGQPW